MSIMGFNYFSPNKNKIHEELDEGTDTVEAKQT